MEVAARSYEGLAKSYLQTAKDSTGDIATIGALLGFLIPTLLPQFFDVEPEDKCGP